MSTKIKEKAADFPKLTKIHLENFQAIKGPTDIELGDITFLIGPNSVGKSAVHGAIKFFQHVLDKGYGERYNPGTMARRYDRSESDKSPLCCVGIEIEVNRSIVELIESRLYDEESQPLIYNATRKALYECCGKIELRLTFYNDYKLKTSTMDCSKNTTKLEVRIDGAPPFLVIGDKDTDNFFDALAPYLPDDYEKLVSNMHNAPEDRKGTTRDAFDLGQYKDLHDSMFWDMGLFRDEYSKPEMFFSESICRLDLNQNVGRTLALTPFNEGSLLESHVLSARNDTLIHRGVYWNPCIKNRDEFVSFENNPYAGIIQRDLLEQWVCSSNMPQINPEKFDDIISRSKNHVKILNNFVGLLIDVFRSALHISHVPADRPIIDSHEPIHMKNEIDWYHSNFHTNKIIRPHFSDHPGGFEPKLVDEPDRLSLNSRSSFKGYEHALAEYAWHNICLENTDQKERKYTDLPEEYSYYFGLSKLGRDFPNLAIEKHLPSLSRYKIKRECHRIVPHCTNKEASTSGSNLTYFRVYDWKLDRVVDFSDLGSGLSFIFPILVSLGESDMSFIEQPELHLHPKAQAEIGDVLLAAKAENRRSIIETHSEQMILRMSKRISETYNLPEGSNKNIQSIRPELEVEAGAIRIHYFEQDENHNDGTQVQEIQFAPDGTLIDDWPDNFFDKNDVNTFSRRQLFSSKAEAHLEHVRNRWLWIDRLKDTPDIWRWFLCAAYSIMIEEMYPVVFPLYASKIAEKLIVDKLLEPFKNIHELDGKKINEQMGYMKSRPKHINQKSYEIIELVHSYLCGKRYPPSLGQCVHFLREAKKNYRVTDIKLIKEFRKFLEDIPEEERKLLWFNNEFISQLGKLANLRGGSAHINDADTSAVKGVEALLINEGKPGILLRAFGYFSD